MLDDFLMIIPSVVAVVASAVGILVAVDQLTQRARMRRIAEWSKDSAEEETNPNRKQVLSQVKTWATGYVLATVMVPARLFLEATIYCLGVPAMVIWISSNSRSIIMVAAFAGFMALWLNIRRALRSYLERYRIAAEYFRDGKVNAPQLTILFQMEGGTRAEFLWSALLAAGLVTASVGTGLLTSEELQQTGVLLLVTGIGISSTGVALIRRATPPLIRRDSSPST